MPASVVECCPAGSSSSSSLSSSSSSTSASSPVLHLHEASLKPIFHIALRRLNSPSSSSSSLSSPVVAVVPCACHLCVSSLTGTRAITLASLKARLRLLSVSAEAAQQVEHQEAWEEGKGKAEAEAEAETGTGANVGAPVVVAADRLLLEAVKAEEEAHGEEDESESDSECSLEESDDEEEELLDSKLVECMELAEEWERGLPFNNFKRGPVPCHASSKKSSFLYHQGIQVHVRRSTIRHASPSRCMLRLSQKARARMENHYAHKEHMLRLHGPPVYRLVLNYQLSSSPSAAYAAPSQTTFEAQMNQALAASLSAAQVPRPVARAAPPPRAMTSDVARSLGVDAATAALLVALQDRDLSENDYNILLALDEAVKPKSLSASKIASFRTLCVGTTYIPGEDPVCVVCMDGFVSGETLRQLPCGHVFHIACIDEWLSKAATTCPTCKRGLE